MNFFISYIKLIPLYTAIGCRPREKRNLVILNMVPIFMPTQVLIHTSRWEEREHIHEVHIFFFPSYETALTELTRLENPTCPQEYLSNASASRTLFASSKGILLPGEIPNTPIDKTQSKPIILLFSNDGNNWHNSDSIGPYEGDTLIYSQNALWSTSTLSLMSKVSQFKHVISPNSYS